MNVTLHAAAEMAAGGLFSAIWEGAVLATLVAVGLRLAPGLSASARSVVWLNVLALLAVLEVVPLAGGHGSAGQAAHVATLRLNPAWSLWIAGIWGVLTVLRVVQLAVGAVGLHALARRAQAVEAGAELKGLLEVRTDSGRKLRTAELCVSTEVDRPSVIGFLRPRILVPPALLEGLTGEEMRQVVLHEMEHLRRGDDWTNLGQKLLLAAFPLNPVLLWVERRLCAERELACDDRVLNSSCGRKAYAQCLARLAEYGMVSRSLSLVLGAWERRPEVVRRVHRILAWPGAQMSGRRTLALTGGLMVAGALCAVVLARSPQLVSFVPVARPAVQAEQAEMRVPAATRGEAREQLVKMVMPETRPDSPTLRKAARKNAVLRTARRAVAPRVAQWVVLTEWRESEMPAHLVFAVEPMERGSYAAVATPNGWLIVQI